MGPKGAESSSLLPAAYGAEARSWRPASSLRVCFREVSLIKKTGSQACVACAAFEAAAGS